jgi:hypothetical protein
LHGTCQRKGVDREALAKCGKVIDILFFYDLHTGVCSTKGYLHLDQALVEGHAYAHVPNTIHIDGFDIILS